MTSEAPDVAFANLGSIVTIRPLSRRARDWIEDNVDVVGWEWLGGALCADPRCAFDIYRAMQADNLACT